jgi:peroxiredoxin
MSLASRHSPTLAEFARTKQLKEILTVKTLHVRYKNTATIFILLFFGAAISSVKAQRDVRAQIQPPNERKPAPAFRLMNASGKNVNLSDFHGKVVLLDFWATDCGGCKIEIPWYMEFDRTYKSKGLAVVGVSMDILYEDLKSAEEGWNKVKPFVLDHKIDYPILMGDDDVTKSYSINALPATYLLDGQGRIAAAYVGLVDKDDMEANIKKLLAEH